MTTIFQKIIDREMPADIVHEDQLCLAFRDIQPQAPTHILLIPKKPIPTLDDIQPEDQALLGHLLLQIPVIAQKYALTSGYRTIINCKEHGGQVVYHLHIHILGGHPMQHPLG
ncbi:MAG: histidine triad nucleotide-binding protein [Deltaproteobacteria bacterium]|nr:histidine triad nucleotide-binding protein [Deltaproteobacteria bacterium]